MKIRNLFLAVIAFVVLAGSVVPANAAGHHRHHHHHHKSVDFRIEFERDPAIVPGLFSCCCEGESLALTSDSRDFQRQNADRIY